MQADNNAVRTVLKTGLKKGPLWDRLNISFIDIITPLGQNINVLAYSDNRYMHLINDTQKEQYQNYILWEREWQVFLLDFFGKISKNIS